MRVVAGFAVLTPVNPQAPTEVLLGKQFAVRCESIVTVETPVGNPPGSVCNAVVGFCQVGEASRSQAYVRETVEEILGVLALHEEGERS